MTKVAAATDVQNGEKAHPFKSPLNGWALHRIFACESLRGLVQMDFQERQIFGVAKRVFTEWNSDNATRWSASVAFYALLSLAPLVVLMVATASCVYGRDAAQGALVFGLRNLGSPDISRAVQSLLTSPHKQVAGLIAILFGGLTLLFGASSVVAELRDALNAIWRVPVDQNSSEFTNLLRLVKEQATHSR